ncbi:hypothetical protein [Bradyrhizobium japonicum]|uniref:hypothetical protein n=1 Tax=Bradyrhizobium japonicum TaxID=375 RepID=UPI002011C9C4|nr:hypothetical protein [Bradyrhizobium japonicum]
MRSSVSATDERVLIATGRYIGEGFDDARLDTLLLALPISWKGTLAQYVGRLHRLYPAKREVVVYDYVESIGGPGRTRTCNLTVMSGVMKLSFVDFAVFSFEFDRVRHVLLMSFLVRNWCGTGRIAGARAVAF